MHPSKNVANVATGYYSLFYIMLIRAVEEISPIAHCRSYSDLQAFSRICRLYTLKPQHDDPLRKRLLLVKKHSTLVFFPNFIYL